MQLMIYLKTQQDTKMSYFRELPNLSYVSRFSGVNRNDERVEVKNLFKRARLRSDIDAAITVDIDAVINVDIDSAIGNIEMNKLRQD